MFHSCTYKGTGLETKKQPIYDLALAREYQKCGLLMYDNYAQGPEYKISGVVRWIPQVADHGRFYIILED